MIEALVYLRQYKVSRSAFRLKQPKRCNRTGFAADGLGGMVFMHCAKYAEKKDKPPAWPV